MHYTAQELIVLLRIALSEPEVGGVYQDTELLSLLNRGLLSVVRDCSTRNNPVMTAMKFETPVVSGAEYYLLPERVMNVRDVAHIQTGQKKQKLVKRNIQGISMNTVYDNVGTRYLFYEVVGKGSPVVAKGVVTTTSDTILHDPNGSFGEVRVGDIVTNDTDNSICKVVSIDNGNVSVENWIGGNSRRFEAGDEYRINTRENTRKQMWVYPILEFSPTSVYKGIASKIKVNADTAVDTIRFKVSGLPEGWQDDTNVAIYVIEGAEPEPLQPGPPGIIGLQPATEPILATSPISLNRVRVGYSSDVFCNFILKQNTEYRIEFRIMNDDTGLLSVHHLVVDEIELFKTKDNFLRINFMPRALKLENMNSICDLEPELVDCLIANGKWRGLEKKDRLGQMTALAKSDYYDQVAMFKDHNAMLDAPGNDELDGDSPDYYNDEPTEGYTNNFGSFNM